MASTTVLHDGAVIKTILKEGHGLEAPSDGARVVVHYTGKLEDGTVFDSSRARGQPFEFVIGSGSVIKGWEVGVAMMKAGETAELKIESSYGYGELGYKTSQTRIPPGATLLFNIELIGFRNDSEISGFVPIGSLAGEVDHSGEGPVKVTDGQAWWERVNEVESYCSGCGENGTTKILPTVIPNFKEILVMSFECPHCGYRNTECRSATDIQEKGVRFELNVSSVEDLNRQVVKGEYATLYVPEISFEVPPITQKGTINTIEGVFSAAIDGLKELQEQREAVDPAVAAQISAFIDTLGVYMNGDKLPFKLIIDDPCGNSFVANPHAPKVDPFLKEVHYTRTNAQQEFLGLAHYRTYEEVKATEKEEASHRSVKDLTLFFDSSGMKTAKEVHHFPSTCGACNAPGETLMCLTDVPHFKEIILMCFLCDMCSNKTVEVKAGGGIAAQGIEYTLKVNKASKEEDLKRDVLKSETSSISIPELELSMDHGTMGGMYTTVEGLVDQIRKQLESVAPQGDSVNDKTKAAWNNLLSKLRFFPTSDEEFTIILHDPCANSWIYSPLAPEPDPCLAVRHFDRSEEENEELGLNAMKTEGYEVIDEVEETAE